MSEKRLYRLEFNEKQQHFHLDNYTHEPNTHGWTTIMEQCDDDTFKIYDSYVHRIKKKKINVDYLMLCKSEMDGFLTNLLEYNFDIYKNDRPHFEIKK
jgi:hypothetical protein